MKISDERLAEYLSQNIAVVTRDELNMARELQAARKVVEALAELLECASLRGDNELPHPADDPKLWTVRMQEAWDIAAQEYGAYDAALKEDSQ